MKSREITVADREPRIIEADESPVLVGASVARVYLPHADPTLPNCVKDVGHVIEIKAPKFAPVEVLSNTGTRVGTVPAYCTGVATLVDIDPVVWTLR